MRTYQIQFRRCLIIYLLWSVGFCMKVDPQPQEPEHARTSDPWIWKRFMDLSLDGNLSKLFNSVIIWSFLATVNCHIVINSTLVRCFLQQRLLPHARPRQQMMPQKGALNQNKLSLSNLISCLSPLIPRRELSRTSILMLYDMKPSSTISGKYFEVPGY